VTAPDDESTAPPPTSDAIIALPPGDERIAPPAALILARAPGDPAPLAGLAPLLDAERRATLQAVLIRRAATWAAAAAPGAAYVAVAPAERLAEVAALLPPAVTVFAADGPGPAIERIGRGPLLVAGTDCPRLAPVHAAAALDDLGEGCDVVFGATLEGGWYLAGLREPRPELLTVAPDAWQRSAGLGPVLQRARELGAEVGMLRHERVLATPGDVAALLADPLLPAELRAALSA
jgi:glycosyltransferase A (GT-A) superfamily protein (DUF2064 family)